MAQTQWARIWELFHTAVAQAPQRRRDWLAERCAGDAALFAEVAGLLHAHEAQDNPLDYTPSPALAFAERAPGTRIGRYRIVRLLGRGGMGQVYLVERDDGEYRKAAALKLIDPALADPRIVEGFLRERQILARLDHPRIARLLDGGRTDDGLPYLVMDYVDGVAIDSYCRTHALGFADRLRLLAQVCDTVDHAHRHLVVHRDLKPGNVLVTAEGEPVLLDFGVARALDRDGDADATVLGERRALTPRYASPEQLAGEAVGTASDVYSLGVLLFELLASAPPHDRGGLTYREFAARLRDGPPPDVRPLARRALPGAPRLPAEIDWICRKALAPQPAQRYRSAHALAEDLRALPAHRPVEARPDSLAYRAGKFLRRHRFAAAGLALLLLLSAAFVWRLQLEALRTREALAQTRIERDRAARVAEFLGELFRDADTTRAGGAAIGAGELLDRGRAGLAARDDLPDAARAALLNALAAVYRNMGRYDVAVELLDEAIALLPAIGSPALEADTLLNLGSVRELAGDSAGARTALTRALALRRDDPHADAAALADAARRLAGTLQSLGERETAGALFREAYDLAAAGAPAERAEAALRLGSWHWTAGDLDAAARLYGEALTARREQSPPDLPELARALDAAATLEHARGRYAQALPLFDEALALRLRALGGMHRHTADTLSNLGALRYDMGEDAGAEDALRRALAIYADASLDDTAVAAKTLNNLGLVRLRQRALDDARTLFERALASHRAAYGDAHPRLAGNLNNLALVAEAGGDLAGAEARLRESLAIGERALGGGHASLAYGLTNLGRVLTWQGRLDEAEALFARARALRVAELPADHPAQAETLCWYGHLRCRAGDAPAGLRMLRDALHLRERSAEAPGSAIALDQTRALLGLCLIAAEGADRDAAQGQVLITEVLPRLRARAGERDPLVSALIAAAPAAD